MGYKWTEPQSESSLFTAVLHFAFLVNPLIWERRVINLKDFFCDDDDRTRRNWKPNVQEKRLFSYIMDRHIRVKVTTHALRCIDKAGGIDEYLLKTPYHKMDTEMGLYWKTKIEKLYEELGQTEVVFFTPEEEAKLEQDFKDMKLSQRAARRELRRQMYGGSSKQKQIEQGSADTQETAEEAAKILSEGIPNEYAPEDLVANS